METLRAATARLFGRSRADTAPLAGPNPATASIEAPATALPEPAVLFVSHDACRAGAQLALLRLLRWLERRGGFRLLVLLKRGGELQPEFERVAELLPAPTDLAAVDGPELTGLRARLRAENVRLIYSNTITNGDLLAVLGCPEIPVLSHVHELDYWIRNRVPAAELEAVRARTDRFIGVSRAVEDCLTRVVGVEPARIERIYEYLDELPDADQAVRDGERTRRELGIPADAFVVGGCGTTDWRKGVDLFIVLAKLVARALPEAELRFLWVGGARTGEQAAPLLHDIERAGLARQLLLLGQTAEPLAQLAAIDVFALTSREDPFPIVNLEAAALGKPVVCFDRAGGAAEFVRDDAGRVVPYLDLAAMAERVVELAGDPALRRRLGETGRRRAHAEHHLDVVGPRIVELLDGYLGAPPR
jgi:glycosyltransferase involved in cell wall biosynthesis